MNPDATHRSKAGGCSAAGSASILIDRCPRPDDHTLALRWHDHHDLTAREQLVRRFMPLARRLARDHARPGEPLEDLVTVATAGLLEALDRHDPGRGVGFTSFATLIIRRALKRYTTGSVMHVPGGAQLLLDDPDDRDELPAPRQRTHRLAAIAVHHRRLRARTENQRRNHLAAVLFASAATRSQPEHRSVRRRTR